MKTRYVKLQSAYIQNPQAETTYFILDKHSPTKCVRVTFEGYSLGSLCSYEFTCSKLVFNNGLEGYLGYQNEYFITHHSLPKKYATGLPMIMNYSNGQFETLTHIRISVKGQYASMDFKSVLNQFSCLELRDTNKKLLTQGINCPVEFGKYPIFFDEEQPSYNRLSEIYQSFYKFNKKRFNEQCEMSSDLCHVRAHFTSEFLRECYGISSIKVYKFYNDYDWRHYKPARYWQYHCVTMLIDSEQRSWIWDPWPNNAKYLISYSEWVHNKNEPKATKILICSSVVINDKKDGKNFDAPNFRYLNHAASQNIFKKLATEAIPNHPERPLLSRSLKLMFWIRTAKARKESNHQKKSNLTRGQASR